MFIKAFILEFINTFGRRGSICLFIFQCGRAEPSEDLDLAMVHLGHKVKDLRRHLRRAIVDHVSDAFLDTNTPLMMLIESAQKHNEAATIENGKMFSDHANKLMQVVFCFFWEGMQEGKKENCINCFVVLLRKFNDSLFYTPRLRYDYSG